MIKDRHVFYIAGFDPRGPIFTYQNCLDETQKWSELTGYPIEVSERTGSGDAADVWTLTSEIDGSQVKTTFHCLRWDDIVRRNWEKNRWRVAFKILSLALPIARSGVFSRARRESWPFTVTMATAALPAALVVVCSILVLAALLLLALAPLSMGIVSSLLLGAAAAGLAWWGHRNIPRFNPDWTGRTGIFAWQLATGPRNQKLERRLDEMADYLVQTVEREKPDETLLMGRSLGTILATRLMVRVLHRQPELAMPGSGVALITLGQLCSLVRDIPEATWYRDELAIIAQFPDLQWLDFSSPPDGACYALVSPLDFLASPPENLPRLLNAQFHRTFSEERMAQSRERRIDMHFLYLKSPDKPQVDSDLYDYVALLAGPTSAAKRFSSRASGVPFFRKTVSA